MNGIYLDKAIRDALSATKQNRIQRMRDGVGEMCNDLKLDRQCRQ